MLGTGMLINLWAPCCLRLSVDKHQRDYSDGGGVNAGDDKDVCKLCNHRELVHLASFISHQSVQPSFKGAFTCLHVLSHIHL